MYLLPILFFLFLLAWRVLDPGSSRLGWRHAFLTSAVIWGLAVLLITEFLRPINETTISIAWGILNVGVIAWLVVKKIWHYQFPPFSLPKGGTARLALGIVLIFIVLIGVTAIRAPPNTWDSMAYHMSRVAHWSQNETIAPYPTNNDRHLFLTPWAEFAILQFQVLTGGDRMANLVSWFSMVASLFTVSLIARHFAYSERAQWMAVAVAASIPMGILQASGTQNDYVHAFWFLGFVYFFLSYKSEAGSRFDFVFMSLCLGLAALTKYTAFMYGVPFGIWIAVICIKKKRIPALIGLVTIVLALNAGHLYRTTAVYGHPLGPEASEYSNQKMSLPFFLSNVVRNLSLHTVTASDRINKGLQAVIAGMHGVMGISPEEPAITYEFNRFRINDLNFNEDESGNPLHFVLAVFSLAGALIFKELRKEKELLGYWLALISGFLIFCLLLKWQIWHSRLHLSLFLLISPLSGLFISWSYGQNKKFRRRFSPEIFLVFLVLISATPWVLMNISRPLIGPATIFNRTREELYFAKQKSIFESYQQAADHVLEQTSCNKVGILMERNEFEYPLWILLSRGGRNIDLFHLVPPENPTANLFPRSPEPCAIFSTAFRGAPEIVYGETIFRAASMGEIVLFLP